MILRFSKADSYSALVRLSRRVTNVRIANKSTVDTPIEQTACAISKCYHESPAQVSNPQYPVPPQTLKKTPKSKSKLTTVDLERVRESQRQDKVVLKRRVINEKIALISYLNVCVDVGQINRAFNTLVSLSGKPRQIVDVHHYNVILRGWADLSSMAQVLETRMHMIRNNIQPNAETFVYVALVQSKTQPTSKGSAKRLIRDMKSNGVDIRKLFQNTYLSPTNRDQIKAFLRLAEPNYDDDFLTEPIDYNCKLLNKLQTTEPAAYDFSGLDNLTQLCEWAEQQRSVENKSSLTLRSVEGAYESSKTGADRYARQLKYLHDIWWKSLSKALDTSLQELQEQAAGDTSKIHLYPYLCSVDKTMLINLMIDEIETNATFSSYSMATKALHSDFGRKIMMRYLRAKSINDGSYQEKKDIYDDYLKNYCTDPHLLGRLNPREYFQRRALKTKNYSIYKDKLTPIEEWPLNIVTAIGRHLYGIILREIKFDPEAVRNPKRDINMQNLVHAFYTAYFQIDQSLKIKEEFRAHQDFERLYARASAVKLRFDFSFLPTISPPLPWISQKFGGYLTNRVDMVRMVDPFAEQTYMTKPVTGQSQKMYPSLDSLNAISLCPWIVNQEILDIVIKLFQAGGDPDLKIPMNESRMSDKSPVLIENPSKMDRIVYNKEKKRYEQKRREMYSLWRDCLYRLSIANHFRDQVIWFPHNMDFRGRTYPVPPHFNHLGADLARSLLLFAKGRPLGAKGLDWLKIHLINLVGSMKSKSLAERLDYANSILHLQILDSADNPWDGRRWWMNNENPWQVLACCKEIAKAIRSRDHTQYLSHFPVHQDGSCNGLQHYAALGRDPAGASAVNLIPCELPQDVYSRVVDIVEKMRQQEAAKGNKVAMMLDGFIQRKVIKQTVMTTVYGVTRYGARQQIARQLAAKGYSERDIWQAASFLTAKTFESIGQMFNKSQIIQSWLNECAYIIASKCRKPVSWETPLGFKVTQPYTTHQQLSTSQLMSSSVGHVGLPTDPLSRLNTSKQKTAFPPNYIHSLDSSHMMLTSLFCHRLGITFVSVHDCYWTHPDTVDAMNRVCREQFVALHSEPLLHQLSNQFISNYGSHFEATNKSMDRQVALQARSSGTSVDGDAIEGRVILSPLMERYDNVRLADQQRTRNKFLDVPETGGLDLNLVRESTYFFS